MRVNKEPRINLLRYQQEEKLERKSNIRFMGILGLAALLFVGALGGTWWMQNQKLQALKAENQQLQRQIDKLNRSAVSTDSGSKYSDKFNAHRTMVEALEKRVKVKSKYLKEIYLLSIPDVTIGKMDVTSDNDFTMSAYCKSQVKFIKYLEQLRELNFVKEVKSVSSKYNTKTGEVNFNITLVWGEAE
ncbi:PilN domain-containing protein [Syntrophomonas curvata]